MTLPELQNYIQTNLLDHFYVFTGPETEIMNIYIDAICEKGQFEKVTMETVQSAVLKLSQKSIMKNPRCIIVREDKEFLKQEKLWTRVLVETDFSDDLLILVFSSIDKRGKYYKTYHDSFVVFDKLSPEILAKYVSKQLPGMPEKDINLLAEICEYDYSRLMLESDKIRALSASVTPTPTGKVYSESFRTLITEGVIYQPVGDITFKLTDAILTRDLNATEELLIKAKAKQEPEIMVLSILYNGFKQILMVQGLGTDQKDASKRTGLTPWQVKMAKEKQGHYSISELINALKTIRFVEKSIKIGNIDADIALDYAVLNIL